MKFNEILILFSGTTDEIEFTFSLLNNVKKDYKFLFRMHPMKHFNVKEYYNYTNFKIVNDMSINKLLRKSGKIVSTYSSIALEYALRGREIGLIYDNGLKFVLLKSLHETSVFHIGPSFTLLH